MSDETQSTTKEKETPRKRSRFTIMEAVVRDYIELSPQDRVWVEQEIREKLRASGQDAGLVILGGAAALGFGIGHLRDGIPIAQGRALAPVREVTPEPADGAKGEQQG